MYEFLILIKAVLHPDLNIIGYFVCFCNGDSLGQIHSPSRTPTSDRKHLSLVVLKVDSATGKGGGRGVRTWVNVCWVCAAGLSEPLPHYSLFFGQL